LQVFLTSTLDGSEWSAFHAQAENRISKVILGGRSWFLTIVTVKVLTNEKLGLSE